MYTSAMRFAAPGTVRLDDSPPVATDIAPKPGAAVRISSQQRYHITPRLWPQRLKGGVDPSHAYVRTYWTAVLGAGAVAELLRVIAAAKHEAAIPHPVFLPVLCREGLVHYARRAVWVRDLVPPLGRRHLARLTPALRQRHDRDLAAARHRWPVAGRAAPVVGGG